MTATQKNYETWFYLIKQEEKGIIDYLHPCYQFELNVSHLMQLLFDVAPFMPIAISKNLDTKEENMVSVSVIPHARILRKPLP